MNKDCPSARFVFSSSRLFIYLRIILPLQVNRYLKAIRLYHPLLFLLSRPNEVYSKRFNNLELVLGSWAQSPAQSITFRIRESNNQIALRGRAFPFETDASGLDVTTSPTPIPQGCKIYLLSPSM